MRIFSNKQRPFHLGTFPLERLNRCEKADLAIDPSALPKFDLLGSPDSEESIADAISDYLDAYESMRDGEPAQRCEDLPDDPAMLSQDVKSACLYLDASMIGICEIPERAWRDKPESCESHTHAVVILVEDRRRPIEPGTPGESWVRGTIRMQAAAHATEVATILAKYFHNLGYAARAHSARLSDLLFEPLLVNSGMTRVESGRLLNPYLADRFSAAVVSTELPLAADLPLAKTPRVKSHGLSYLLGLGGVRPGWKRMTGDHRPLHLSRYPMEKLKRVDRPTTIVEEDKIPRVPRRAEFFERAMRGDLGEKAQQKAAGLLFAFKHPLSMAMRPIFLDLVPMQDGEVATTRAENTDNPEYNSAALKMLAYFVGADLAGVCETKPFMWYSHTLEGEELDPKRHPYAMSMLIDQGYETMEGASGDDWISGVQSMRAYLHGSHQAGIIANHIRRLGYSAKTHTVIHGDMLQLPVQLFAGLGEMARIGELVLNPFVGPRFKSVVITTDMPLAPDKPVDFGLQEFCSRCYKCARECPCNAISARGKVMFNHYEIWKPDVERCTRYRVTNHLGAACGRCMKMCPYNTEGVLKEYPFLWLAMHFPKLSPWIAKLDDRMGHGSINRSKKWWFDLEMQGDKAVVPKGARQRELHIGEFADPARPMAMYQADRSPPPVSGPVAPDRKQAVKDYEEAETAVSARERLELSGVG